MKRTNKQCEKQTFVSAHLLNGDFYVAFNWMVGEWVPILLNTHQYSWVKLYKTFSIVYDFLNMKSLPSKIHKHSMTQFDNTHTNWLLVFVFSILFLFLWFLGTLWWSTRIFFTFLRWVWSCFLPIEWFTSEHWPRR